MADTNHGKDLPEPKRLSHCHNAPVVLCEGNAWDIPAESIRSGSTYFYGCTECHEACDLALDVSSLPDRYKDMIGSIPYGQATVKADVDGSIYEDFPADSIHEPQSSEPSPSKGLEKCQSGKALLSFDALYDLIDGWYHEQTRHHLVDVDKAVYSNLFGPLQGLIAQHTKAAVLAEQLNTLLELDNDMEGLPTGVIFTNILHNRIKALQAQQVNINREKS